MEGTSASASSSTVCYKVFINHRGPDVKKTLASVIYQYLRRQGLQVFFDKDEFQPGQPLNRTIEDAIKTSSVHIAIFSQRYAESDWCLKELCLMLETEVPIIPVFYDVRPSDLRWIEKGKYAFAFEKHEKQGRFDFPTISTWKSALQDVSRISGLDLQDPNTLNGDWGQLLKSLEDTVSQNLKPGPVVVTTDPVGLDEAIRDFESFVQREQQNKNEEVKIVGIVGLGGSGKTTLATEIFNRRRPSFERSSFLFTREDAGNKKPLPQLQSQLLQDLVQVKDCTIRSVYEGIPIIREKLQSLISPSSPVLIVVDDIDDASQVEALAVKDALGSGSLIILTSRDEQLLKPSDASIYKIKALSTQNAQDLFCKHAFQQPYPTVGFENLVKKFCEKCGGWPLFLKLMGGHLRANASNDSKLWEDELKYTHKDILDIIELSYNALCKEEKQIFLDIACFFLGEDKDLAIKVWDTCEGRGLLRLNILVNKCLVELDDNNCFKMHDRVRDFGREIANTESPCRLWNESQAANFRGQAKATKEVRGIMAATSLAYFDFFGGFRSSFYKPPLEGIELSALKILAIDGACIDEQVCGTLKNLVWLRWFRCPHKNIPPWLISMKNLTVLEFIEGEIEVWPVRGEQVHLKELRIALTNLSMISTSQNVCSNLEHLDLHANIRLKKVEPLPRKLVKLNLKDCMFLEDVQALEHLPQLRDLDISKCSELCELPKLQHLPSLETLDASYCSNLQRIQGLEDLLHLRNLKISHCYKLCELPNLQHLPSLETLDASSCSNLHRIQGLEDLLHLRNLNISGCSELRELPKLQDLPSLETFDASYCTNLQRIQGLEQLPQLRNLKISRCYELRELPKLQDLPSLETFDAFYCTNLQRIQGLEQLPQLRNLNISRCSELRELSKLQDLPSLETLDASHCPNLQRIQGLEHLPQLRNLNISFCSELRELPKLQDLPSLETLDASHCPNLQRIQGLEHLPQLRNLSISGCSELRELPKLQDLPSLETLDASYCSNLQRIQGLEQLPQLRNLNISGCYELQEFPNLAQLISLEEFKADGCWKLHGIQGLDQLEKLKLLTLSADDSGTIWNVLEDMKKLPGSTCVSANVEDLNIRPVIDLNIRLIELREMQANVREWEFIGENRPTCFMICLVVQFPTVRFQRDFSVVMKYKNGRIDWKMRVKEGEWVYALICSREYNSVERISVWTSLSRAYLVFGDEDSENDADVDRIRVWTSLCPADVVFGDGDEDSENEAECSGYELKERWMEGGSEAKILEAAKKLFAP